MRIMLLSAVLTLAVVPIAMAQGGEERWELTITLGPCEAFAEGTFTVLYAGSIGRYLVGELEAESQCTGESAANFVLAESISNLCFACPEHQRRPATRCQALSG